MLHKAWNSEGEMPYCYSTSSVKFQGHTALKIVEFHPNWGFPDCNLSFQYTNGYQMVHKAWSRIEKMPYCFSRSYVKLQGHTALKIVDFDPNWAFPDCISSLESSMATKWCTKLAVTFKRCPIVFKVILQISRSHGSKNRRIWPKLGVSGL